MKKTDMGLFKEMLERAEIKYETGKDGNFYADDKPVNSISLTADKEYVMGYNGFQADFTFDPDTGALKNIYLWE